MRVRTTFRIAAVILVVVAAVIVAAQFDAFSFLGPDLLSRIGVIRSNRVQSSRIVLQEMREVYTLNTIEYVYRTVFPYDFLPPEVTLESVLKTLRTGTGSIETLLSPRQLQYFEAYNLSQEVGLQTTGGDFEFLVVTVIVGAGFDLGSTALAFPNELSDVEAQSIVTIDETRRNGQNHRIITVPLPESVITYVLIEDRNADSYPYPDVSIQPAGWRRVADFVSDRVRQRTIDDGILTEASERGRESIRSVLLEAGYDEVRFR